MTNVPGQANLPHLQHAFKDMSKEGIGPQRVCVRCGEREGSKNAQGACQPGRYQPARGAVSEYDPISA